jgi:hypothetical protein
MTDLGSRPISTSKVMALMVNGVPKMRLVSRLATFYLVGILFSSVLLIIPTIALFLM